MVSLPQVPTFTEAGLSDFDARGVAAGASHHDEFVNYGNAEDYRRELQALRTKLTQLNAAERE